jgi:hypothetical protein
MPAATPVALEVVYEGTATVGFSLFTPAPQPVYALVEADGTVRRISEREFVEASRQ